MQKSFSVLLIGALLMVLVSCGGGAISSTSNPQVGTSPSVPNLNSEPLEMFTSKAGIEETVLVDESDIKITATELSYDRSYPELKLTIENNTNKNLTFYAGTLGYSRNSINGYMISSGYLNVDVTAGKKANDSIHFDADELALLGITDIADIEIGFNVQDDNYDTYLQTGPRQLKTTLADGYDYDTDSYQSAITGNTLGYTYYYSVQHYASEELYNQKGIRIISEVLLQNTEGELALLLELVNEGTDPIEAVVSDISLNGLVVYSSTWDSEFINGGKRYVMNMKLSSALDSVYWDVYGLSKIGDITFSLGLKDENNQDIAVPSVINVAIPGNEAVIDNSGAEVYNRNGIRIVSKGLVPDSSDYSDDIHALFLVENSGSIPVDIDDAYDSLSINGFMTDYFCYSRTVTAGQSAVIDVELQESSLNQSGISSLNDITELEMTFEIRNSDYKKLAEPTITVKY